MANISKIKLPNGTSFDLKDNSAVPKYGLGENILDNWYFLDPVNQRGQNSYSISSTFVQNVYTIDRWKITGSYFTVSLTSSGLELTKTNNITSTYFSQYLPKLDTNQTYTFSAIINDELCVTTGQPGSSSSTVTYTINNVTFDMSLVQYIGDHYEVQFIFSSDEVGTITIKAVKLEVGMEQTLIQKRSGNLYLTENPDHEQELLRCEISTADPADDYANKVVGINNSNKNLVDNWYFVGGGTGHGVFPINQRHITSSSSGYAFDRWRPFGSGTNYNWSLTTAGLQFENSSSSNYACPQDLSNAAELLGKRVTYSILTTTGLYKNSGVLPSTFNNSAGQISVSDGTNIIGQLYVTSSNIQVRMRSPANSGSITFIAVKLELGTQQTLAHLEKGSWILNEVPDYEEELVKCQTSTADSSDTYANKTVSVNVTNRNLLDNWYFVGGGNQGGNNKFPINQRGQTQYSTNGFCIDRWNFTGYSGGTAILNSNGLTITKNNATANPGVQQNFDFDLDNQMITFSLLTTAGVLYTKSYGPLSKSASGWQLSYNAGIFWVGLRYQNNGWNLSFTVPNQLSVAAVKLELGTQQTLARSYGGTWVLNEIPNYNNELIKCQTSVADVNDTFANQAVSVNATNRNLLDNWYFVPSQVRGGQLPINRRGRTAQSILQTYFIDRWALFDGDGSASLKPGGLSLTGGQNWFRFGQQIPFWKVAGKQVTLSVLIESITDGATFNAFFGESTGLIVNNYSPVGATSITATSAGLYQTTAILTKNASGTDNDLLNVLFRITQARTVIIKAVKLEYGSQQTLAHLEKGEWVLNEIPDYAEELVKCETNQAAPTDTYANKVVSVNIPNRNLLDNAYFIGGGSQSGTLLPINQRAQTSYTQGTGLQKIFDRWQLNRGTAALTSNGVNLSWGGSSVGGNGATLRQVILGNPYIGKTVTLSLLYNGSTNGGLLTLTTTMRSSMSEYSVYQDNIYLHISIYNSDTLIDIEVRNTTAKTLYAVKLELGTEQTLVHQENGGWVLNEIPAYRDELWTCQRYLQIIKAPSSNNTISVASAGSATVMYGNITLAPMISTPTISATNLIYGTSSLNKNVSSVSFISFDNNSGFGTLQFNVASGLTTGAFYRVGIAVDTNLIFSSEP